MITLNYPFPAAAARANLATIAEICRAGGVIIYPTETFYAIGGNALDKKLGEKLSRIKNRPADKPFPTLGGSRQSLEKLVAFWPEPALALAARYWPGALTLILPAAANLPAAITGRDNSVAVRWSPHPLIHDLNRISDLPLISTSANLSDRPPTPKAADLDPEILAAADLLIIADNNQPDPLPSTIVDARTDPPLILRPGVVTIEPADSEKND